MRKYVVWGEPLFIPVGPEEQRKLTLSFFYYYYYFKDKAFFCSSD